ncbi:threonine/serine dehydratase [Rhodobacteraceae bacterium RKSG542]|uniref:threonine ammonia-lyase n=1 Tax=Pseudovibrio flavus TaxID=2529854 RepID=UPI0012BBC014|nr:threonine/serine dehydratase [Pseudovibrio flavus]MTI19232.1 threonine/serine dehydratase [Pseudovibrio flavus]
MSKYTPVDLTFSEIIAASKRIEKRAFKTPLLRNDKLDQLVGGRVFIKPECLQQTGSFKFRGAFNRLQLIPEADRAKGVVACSSGNHAQGIAYSASLLGMPATIVMPQDAPKIKVERTRAFGADVVLYDRANEDRDAIAEELCSKTGATFVHPFNDTGVIVGQGTVGLEVWEQTRALGVTPDLLVSCTGGGGLTSGIALALETLLPECGVYTAEPEGFDDYARSLAADRILENERKAGSICDAVLTPAPGENGFSVMRRRAAGSAVVTDQQALEAVAFAISELKLVVEPGGAVALASLLSGKIDVRGKTAVIILSGGNIDPELIAKALV